MNPENATPAAPASPELPPRLAQLAVPVGQAALFILTGVALADFLFWEMRLGFNVGLMAAFVVAGLAVCQRERIAELGGTALAGFVFLLMASVLQSLVATGLTNGLVLLTLVLVAAGELGLRSLAAPWQRWLGQALALLRWPTALERFFAEAASRRPQVRGAGTALNRGLLIALPALLLLFLFGALMGSGNAVAGRLIRHLSEKAADFLTSLSLPAISQVFFWLATALALLCLVRPQLHLLAEKLLGEPPRFSPPRGDFSLARWQSIAALATVNVIFLLSNTLDVLYLWFQTALPEGLSFAEYVHRGVYSLIGAVVVAAFILVLIFQQREDVLRGRLIRALALLWILQNLVLISGVFLRLELYIETYWLTPKRVYVGCFLLLVVSGFVLLAIHVWKRKGLRWLILRNLAAVFILFFVLQFLPVRSWVADVNFSLWQENPERDLGRDFFEQLGPAGWPTLRAIASSPEETPAVEEARAWLRDEQARVSAQPERNWREMQWREARQREKLLEGVE